LVDVHAVFRAQRAKLEHAIRVRFRTKQRERPERLERLRAKTCTACVSPFRKPVVIGRSGNACQCANERHRKPEMERGRQREVRRARRAMVPSAWRKTARPWKRSRYLDRDRAAGSRFEIYGGPH